MTARYLFILGHSPALSVAEIVALAQAGGLKIDWLDITQSYALVEADVTLDFFEKLAGSVKLVQVLDEIEYKEEAVRNFIGARLNDKEGEVLFGFSWYGAKVPVWLRPVGMEFKRIFKESGRRARLVESRQTVLSSVVVKKNHLLPPRGTEFIFQPVNETRLLIGQTVAVQEFAEWSERDYGRPARDAKVGMLPPKLARLMINLAAGRLAEPILDPFCGSGTVLQEAAALGYRFLWGSDIDGQGIKRTQTNLDWLKGRHPEWSFDFKLLVKDVRHLKADLADTKFGAMVTEPYLGPTSRLDNLNQYREVEHELVNLYRAALKSLAALILPKRRLVMVWPVFYIGAKPFYLPLLKELSSLGWQVEKLLPPPAPVKWQNERGSLLYERPGQRVGREILVLRRV